MSAPLDNRLEHRWGERVQVNIPVRLSAATLAGVDGSMKNLSMSGAFVKSDYDWRRHVLIEVRIAPPLPLLDAAVVEAHVARKLEEGVGIEWCEFAPRIVRDWLRSQWQLIERDARRL